MCVPRKLLMDHKGKKSITSDMGGDTSLAFFSQEYRASARSAEPIDSNLPYVLLTWIEIKTGKSKCVRKKHFNPSHIKRKRLVNMILHYYFE